MNQGMYTLPLMCLRIQQSKACYEVYIVISLFAYIDEI